MKAAAIAVLVGLLCFLGVQPAAADYDTPYFHIPYTTQSGLTLLTIYSDTTFAIPQSSVGCPGTPITGQYLLQDGTTSGSNYYDKLAPFILAAFLYNKAISLHLGGCTSWNLTLVTGATLQN